MKLLLSAIAAIGLAATSAHALVVPWTATLDQAQEIPAPTIVPGAGGSASGQVDTVTGDLSWMITYAGLSGAPTGMHFHGPAPAGSTAGVEVNIGNISGLGSPSSGSTTITASQVSDLLNGLWYINIHTAANGPGEIRGQVDPVPLPAALPLMLGVIGAVAYAARRRA